MNKKPLRPDGEEALALLLSMHQQVAFRHTVQRAKARRSNGTQPGFLSAENIAEGRVAKSLKAHHVEAIDTKTAVELRQTVGALRDFALPPSLWNDVQLKFS